MTPRICCISCFAQRAKQNCGDIIFHVAGGKMSALAGKRPKMVTMCNSNNSQRTRSPVAVLGWLLSVKFSRKIANMLGLFSMNSYRI